jgi:SET domain-containing protein
MTVKRKAAATPRKSYIPGDFALKVKRSSAGMGLFAGADIPKGACVIEYIGRELSKDEWYTVKSKYLFEVTKQKTIDGSPRWNLARYINHSCKPNCEPEIHRARVYIRAKRAIKAGEELVYNYGPDYFRDFIEPHGCRCEKCTAARARAAE